MALNDPRKYQLRARAERQQETRDRIVAATVALHREVGPARTTIAGIARRAGVQRLTVYNHFPELADLLGACQGRFLAESPPPDIAPDPTAPDPLAAFEQALLRLYAWFRANQAMERHVHHDRHLVPELDALLRATADANVDAIAGAHADNLAPASDGVRAVRALVRVALDFTTWALLTGAGLDDAAAAHLMRAAVAGVSVPR